MDAPSIYTSELIKSLLKSDNENYKVVPNKSQRVSAACWKNRGMGFPAKKLNNKDEFTVIPGFASCSKCFETYRYVNSSTTHINAHKCLNLLPSDQTSLDHHFPSKSLAHQTEQRTVPITKAIARKKEAMKKVCAVWIAHSMRSFKVVQDPGFKAVIGECLKIAANERLLLKDRLVEAVKYGGVCISPDIWSDQYRKISYLGATAHFVGKDTKYYSVDLFCTEFTARKKSGENIMKLLRTELASFGLENYLSDIIFVTDRGANFIKEKTPNKTTKYRTTIEASPEIDSEVEMTDDENTYDTDESEITDDDDIDYSSITIFNLPTSAKKVLDTIRYCKALVKYIKKANLNRHIQLEHEKEDYNPTADEDESKKQFSKFTTLHQCSAIRWLSLHDLLSSIQKAYHPLKQILNEKQESSRLEKININVVAQLIKFLDPWKYVMNEIQLSNSPSLFIILPCIAYLKQQITKSERTMRGGMSFFAKRSIQLLESMFKIENLHVMGTFLHPNYKQLKHATQIQIIECHNSCRLAIPPSSTSTYSVSDDNNEINEPLTKKPKRFLESLMDDITPPQVSQTKDEVDVYIDLQLKDNEIYTNPLTFWQQHEYTFPHLSKFARKIFAVPCSSAAVEREFSAAGQLVTQRRSNIEPSTINDILFLRSIENSKRLI
ncbi:unnamed protein product [Rotaria socialis]|uniref:HAT C-terminal dimerisation domain-containing protein n=1 Tax=Rotaria socialis TaxID=392032 RepID=A0A818PCQ0_9BILA|nr:unnamed protein product [Rotaria socialis]